MTCVIEGFSSRPSTMTRKPRSKPALTALDNNSPIKDENNSGDFIISNTESNDP